MGERLDHPSIWCGLERGYGKARTVCCRGENPSGCGVGDGGATAVDAASGGQKAAACDGAAGDDRDGVADAYAARMYGGEARAGCGMSLAGREQASAPAPKPAPQSTPQSSPQAARNPNRKATKGTAYILRSASTSPKVYASRWPEVFANGHDAVHAVRFFAVNAWERLRPPVSRDEFVQDVCVEFLAKFRWDEHPRPSRALVIAYTKLLCSSACRRVIRAKRRRARMEAEIAQTSGARNARGKRLLGLSVDATRANESADRELHLRAAMLAVTLSPAKYMPAMWMLMRGDTVVEAARRCGVTTQALQHCLAKIASEMAMCAKVAEAWTPAQRLAEKRARASEDEAAITLRGHALAMRLQSADRLLRALGEPGVAQVGTDPTPPGQTGVTPKKR